MVSFTVRMQFAKDDRDRVTEILRNLALASREGTGMRKLRSSSR